MGGYLSTAQAKGVTFVDYLKMRILGADNKFREDKFYIMFMFLLKETIEMKRSRVTFFRKARLHHRDKTTTLKEAARDELERHDIGFKGKRFSTC